MDGTRCPDGCLGNEAVKELVGCCAEVVTAFRMPLDSDDEVGNRAFCGLSPFYSLDYGVLRAAGGDSEAVAGDSDGLMVAGVDGKAEVAVLFGRLIWGDEGAKEGVGGNGRCVGDGNAAARGMVDREDAEVLDQSSTAPDVEELEAEADGQDGLVEVVGVLEEEFVDVFAGVIGRSALRKRILAVFVRVDVGGAAREEDGLTGVDEIGYLGGGGMQRNLDGGAAGPLDCGGILGPGTLVIGEVSAGGYGDGYAGLHWLSMMIRRSITDLRR
jgi:hypothetical protein